MSYLDLSAYLNSLKISDMLTLVDPELKVIQKLATGLSCPDLPGCLVSRGRYFHYYNYAGDIGLQSMPTLVALALHKHI